MKDEILFWTEIENAVSVGLIRKMEEVSKPFLTSHEHPRIYGTRIWFGATVTSNGIANFIKYIEEKYEIHPEQDFPLSITVWHKI